MTTEAEFLGRLKELLKDAREAGVLRALRPLLAGALNAAHENTGEKVDVSQRFGLVGSSEPMKQVFALIDKVAPKNVPVLVLGETGTGKELVARALHDYSPRSEKPFLAENCAAVSAELLESELFGHVKGSFTGAIADRVGHFVAASRGTVFLDEIGDMPLAMQAKLLRVLQEGEVRPVGSNKTVSIDVRIVAATNKDLAAMVSEGNFREDLYYRLNVITIPLPPLRERAGDVSALVRFFLERINTDMNRNTILSDGALEALEAWSWPGNVRELDNELQRAVALSSGVIERRDLSPRIVESL